MRVNFRLINAAFAAGMVMLAPGGHAAFEKIADLNAVSVSTDANFQVGAGRDILRTWIRLDFKQEQRFDLAPNPLQARTLLAYRSRKDYVQVDCRRNLYGELATQMFSEPEGKGDTVFESTYMRSAMPRFATPSTHEGVVLIFLCKGIKPEP
jgi:hypothetical protein